MADAFTVRADVTPVIVALRDQIGRQLPYALRLALNRTAQQARERLVQEMASRFDRPTPYTLNSVWIAYATKDRLEAKVWVKDEAGKGTPAERYLGPEVVGGARRQKRYERALQSVGILPAGWYTVLDALRLAELFHPVVIGFSAPGIIAIQQESADEPVAAPTDMTGALITVRYRILYETAEDSLSQ